MARPIKNNADYFSHDNDMRDDERIKAVRRKFSHLGYSTWNMLLERLCRAENFKVEYSEDSIDIMAGDFNIDPQELKEIIDYLIKLKLIIQEDEIIFSQTMINRFEMLFRKRKRDSERLSSAITPQQNIIASDNAHSKVKNSKVNKREEKKIKEKGNKENSPPIFSNSFLEDENAKPLAIEKEKNIVSAQKEKSSAQKENFTEAALPLCKQVFEKFSPQYVWETKDREQLAMLLQKICITKPDVQSEKYLAEAFLSFLQKLPEYWRTKKFTIPNLNYNYNEIVSEIRANKNSVQEKKQILKQAILPRTPEIILQPSAEEKQKTRTAFIQSICENYESFASSGETTFLPLWAMYDTLMEENILKLSEKKLHQYRKQAEKENNPENKNSVNSNDKNKMEIIIKSLAVKGLFNELKKTKTNIKTLFKNKKQ